MNPSHAVSIECVGVSSKCHAAAIIVITTSGLSAMTIARYRPRCPVLAIVRHGRCARKISVWRNIVAVHYLSEQSDRSIELVTLTGVGRGRGEIDFWNHLHKNQNNPSLPKKPIKKILTYVMLLDSLCTTM